LFGFAESGFARPAFGCPAAFGLVARSARTFGAAIQYAPESNRLPKELALAGITSLEAANRFLKDYHKRCKAQFQASAREEGAAFVPWMRGDLADILCERHERMVGSGNCVKFEKRRRDFPQTGIVAIM
jgi:hypothetical protein